MTSRKTQLLEWLNKVTPYHLEALEQVSGDASFRRYFRFQADGLPFIAVDAPPETENTQSFVKIGNAYNDLGIRVPQIIQADVERGFMQLEDLGNTLLGQVINDANYRHYYDQALQQLIKIQSVDKIEGKSLPPYDNLLLERDHNLFSDWLLAEHLNLDMTSDEKSMLSQVFDRLSDNFKSQPQVGVHRDYHSRNIMVLEGNALGIIDFQDAVVGPLTYDAVSLLKDCYMRWPSAEITELLRSWYDRYFTHYPWETFKRWFDLTGVQRHMKASGIFARLNHRDNKPLYLDDIPRTLGYIVDTCKQYDEFTHFACFVEQRVIPLLGKS